MNRKFMFGSAALMLALGFTACSSQEDALQTADEVLTSDTNFFFNIEVSNPTNDGSRADGDYDAGTSDEQKINSILFTFYNSQDALVGATTIRFDGASNPEGTDYTTNGTTWQSTGQPVASSSSNGTVTTVIVPVKVQQGNTIPAKVIAIINQGGLNTAFNSLTSYLDEKVDLKQAQANGFLMSNSVYYSDNYRDTKAKVAAEIESSKVYDTAEAAKAGESSATIYVERVVAKVKMQMANNWTSNSSRNWVREWDETGNVNASKSGHAIAFKAISWALTCNEKESYLLKNFRNGNFYEAANMTKDEAKNAFDVLLPDWNSEANHRSFWATSPNYYRSGDTPKSDRKGITTVEYITVADALAGNSLSRPSFAYSLENTRNAEAVTKGKSGIVSGALVVGQYIDGSTYTTGTYDKNAPDFYLRRFTTANDAETQVMKYDTEAQLIKAFFAANESDPFMMLHYQGPSGIGWHCLDRDDASNYLGSYFEIKPIDDDDYFSYYVTLQIKEETKHMGDFALIVNHTGIEKDDYVFVTEDADHKSYYESMSYKVISFDQANREIANHFQKSEMAYVEKYTKGLAYFTMPIKHIWAKQNEKSIGDHEFKATLGQYGVVRNHIYDLEIKGFEGIGKPAGDPDKPTIIIPTPETEKYFVKSEVRVQPWRLVPTQSDVLRP